MDDKTYQDAVVRICELVGDSDILDGFTFVGCQINGPAVLAFENSTLIQDAFQGNLDAILWEVSRPKVIGAILARNCTFERCTFALIGVAGPPDFIAQMRRELGS